MKDVLSQMLEWLSSIETEIYFVLSGDEGEKMGVKCIN